MRIQRLIHFFLLIILSLPLILLSYQPSKAQAGDAWELISEVNALRVSYGLPPLEVNNSLMSAAQGHSAYQAQIGTWTHTGPGGSRPRDRAIAAGYGGGAQVYVSENVATGINLSPHDTVYQMWQDAIHLETMISPSYREIGAGVASSDGWVYYTIDVGYVAGSAGDNQPPPSTPGIPGTPGTPRPTEPAAVPIKLATPGPDGTVVHVVQWGQFLENIAKAYKVELNDVLALNGITMNAVIFPGDKILITRGTTPIVLTTASGTLTGTVEKTPGKTKTLAPAKKLVTSTPTPKATKESEPVFTDVPRTAEPTAWDSGISLDQNGPDYLLFAIIALAASGTGLILFGSALRRNG